MHFQPMIKVEFQAFKTLILGHCKEGSFEEAYELLLSMLTDIGCYDRCNSFFFQKGRIKMLNSGLPWA
jgi:pentatricopeptide repeat protein